MPRPNAPNPEFCGYEVAVCAYCDLVLFLGSSGFWRGVTGWVEVRWGPIYSIFVGYTSWDEMMAQGLVFVLYNCKLCVVWTDAVAWSL